MRRFSQTVAVATVCLLVALWPSEGRALTVEQYIQFKAETPEEMQIYFFGVLDGLKSFQALLIELKNPALFCFTHGDPRVQTLEHFDSLVKTLTKEQRESEVAQALIASLIRAYPCK